MIQTTADGTLVCVQCGHEWRPRGASLPRLCVECGVPATRGRVYPKISPERRERLDEAIRILARKNNGKLRHGTIVELARIYGVSRQRMYQIQWHALAGMREAARNEEP